MASSLTERLIAHLRLCRCCRCEAACVSKSEDGIPDEYVHETLFGCGARILVSRNDDYSVTYGCPYPADDALQGYRQDLIDGIADEDGGL